MANPKWGNKHTCPSCSAKFYDLKKNPIICPSCEQEVVVQQILKPRRQTPAEAKPVAAPKKEAAVKTPDDADDDDDLLGDDDDDLVLDDDEDEDDDSLIEDTSDIDDDDDVGVAVKPEKDDTES